MKHEYLMIGYIRSNCLSKVASCIDTLPKTQLSISRSKQEKKAIKSDYKWLQYNLLGKGDFQINWNVWRDKTPFEKVLEQLTHFKNKYHFEDFVVNKLEVAIDDPKLVDIINHILVMNNEKRKYPDVTRFYVTFKNKPLATDVINGWDGKVIKDINLNAIVNLKFKRAVLDLVSIESEWHKTDRKKTEPFMEWLVNEKEVIWQILSHLDTTRWMKFPEVKKHYTNGHHPYPGAIRTYERKQGVSRWSFTKDEEVIINGNNNV